MVKMRWNLGKNKHSDEINHVKSNENTDMMIGAKIEYHLSANDMKSTFGTINGIWKWKV